MDRSYFNQGHLVCVGFYSHPIPCALVSRDETQSVKNAVIQPPILAGRLTTTLNVALRRPAEILLAACCVIWDTIKYFPAWSQYRRPEKLRRRGQVTPGVEAAETYSYPLFCFFREGTRR